MVSFLLTGAPCARPRDTWCLKDTGSGIICLGIRPSSISQATWSPVICISGAHKAFSSEHIIARENEKDSPKWRVFDMFLLQALQQGTV